MIGLNSTCDVRISGFTGSTWSENDDTTAKVIAIANGVVKVEPPIGIGDIVTSHRLGKAVCWNETQTCHRSLHCQQIMWRDLACKATVTRQWVVDLCKRGSHPASCQDRKQDSPAQERAQNLRLLDVQRACYDQDDWQCCSRSVDRGRPQLLSGARGHPVWSVAWITFHCWRVNDDFCWFFSRTFHEPMCSIAY